MKRYLSPYFFFFDTTPNTLSLEVSEAWEPEIKEQHERNRKRTLDYLKRKFGELNAEAKLHDFVDVGELPFSVVSYHSALYQQCRDCFVSGAYYPALIGTCALGERILNHLIIDLRENYSATATYRKVKAKNSFNDWDVMIAALAEWGVFSTEVVASFSKLAKLRHFAVHYRPDLYRDLRGKALEALRTLADIIRGQFGTIGRHRWFIPTVKGSAFICQDWESDPFVKKYYVDNTVKVGPHYAIRFVEGHIIVFDRTDYPATAVDDATFAELFNSRDSASVVSTDLPPAPNVDMRMLVPGGAPVPLMYAPDQTQ